MTGRTASTTFDSVITSTATISFIFLSRGRFHQHSPEIDGHESQPNDASRVHGETDVFRLVESRRDLAGHDSVDGAQQDQQDRISKSLVNPNSN